ncbi:MAG: hypothetical protein OIN83_09380 [Candidatus Methanoperedens sp.]|nr:hypothetical protein [Candidatus Methanoperedens sp.]
MQEDIDDGSPSFDIAESKKRKDYGAISEEIGLSYEYVRPDTGFFFYYQNEGIENGIRKPLYHLHVGIKKDADKNLLPLRQFILIKSKK